MVDVPAPLVPAEVDLRDFAYMPLEVARLRQSSTLRKTTGDEFRCAILLWCASWHQVPAASLPNDDQDLADYAGFGFAVDAWQRVKAGAMRGWVLCSDGRWYHPVVAEKALNSWREKLLHKWRKECDRVRKTNESRRKEGKTPLELPPRPMETRTGSEQIPQEQSELPLEEPAHSGGSGDGIPPEKALKGMEGNIREVGDNPQHSAPRSADGLAQFKTRIVDSFRMAGSMKTPDTHRAELWVTQGYKPAICLAVIGELLANKPEISGLKYFDRAIAEAHELPQARGDPTTSRRSTNGLVNIVINELEKQQQNGLNGHRFDHPAARIEPGNGTIEGVAADLPRANGLQPALRAAGGGLSDRRNSDDFREPIDDPRPRPPTDRSG